jgi:hypothetical protein
MAVRSRSSRAASSCARLTALLAFQHRAFGRDQPQLVLHFLHPLPSGEDGRFGFVHRGLRDVAAPEQRRLPLQVLLGERQRASLDLERGLRVGFADPKLGELCANAFEVGFGARHDQQVVGHVDLQDLGAGFHQPPALQPGVLLLDLAAHLRDGFPDPRRGDRAVACGARHEVDRLDLHEAD